MKQVYLLFALVFILGTAPAQITKLVNNEGLELLGVVDNKAIFYSSVTSKLWVTNGTTGGTFVYTQKVLAAKPSTAALLNGKLIFIGTTPAHGNEIWSTDGTDAGTFLVKDINPGTENSDPNDGFDLLNNELYFSAYTATNGRELWKTDGTNAGTIMVKEIMPGTASSAQPGLYKTIVVGNQLFFAANTLTHGVELWRTDGTADGTQLVKDIMPGTGWSQPVMLGHFNNKLVFQANAPGVGAEPWVSDGTANGTFMLADINPGIVSSAADQFTRVNDKILFAAFNNQYGHELWQTDLTTGGTRLLKDIEPGELGSQPTLVNGIAMGNRYFFMAGTEQHGLEMWVTDGTAAGTELFFDANPGAETGYPFIMPRYNFIQPGTSPLFQGNQFFFIAFNANVGVELYITDGTMAGTRLVKDLAPGIEDGIVTYAYYITNNAVYFSGVNGAYVGELFSSDGTAANTQLVGAVNNNGQFANVQPFMVINNALLFYGEDADNINGEPKDLYRVTVQENVLPITLQRFNGQRLGNANQLEWLVQNAQGFSSFTLERSSNGVNYAPVATVPWHANQNKYTFTDGVLPANVPTWYYRLKLNDADGSFTYSKVVSLQVPNTPLVKVNKTSPAALRVTYNIPANAQLTITDLNGRVLLTQVLPHAGTVQNIALPAQAPQVLLVTVAWRGQRFTAKVW